MTSLRLINHAIAFYTLFGGYTFILAIKINKVANDLVDCTPYFKSISQGFTVTSSR